MGDHTSIEWSDATWNPLLGCDRVSEGCDGCYAIGVVHRKMSPQHEGLTIVTDDGVDWNGEVHVAQAHGGGKSSAMDAPTRWKKPRRIFVNSLSDVFHQKALGLSAPDGTPGSESFLVHLMAEMVANPRHTFQVLTKRPQIAGRVLRDGMFRLMVNAELLRRGFPVMPDSAPTLWPPHIIWVTSIELDKYAWRASHLTGGGKARSVGTVGISAEPLLGPLPSLDLTGVAWLIVGGESGPKARPMHPDWARDLRDRSRVEGQGVCPICNGDESIEVDGGGCAACPGCFVEYAGGTGRQHTAFFFKQWGEWAPANQVAEHVGPTTRTVLARLGGGFSDNAAIGLSDALLARVGTKRAGRQLDRRLWDEFPTTPTTTERNLTHVR